MWLGVIYLFTYSTKLSRYLLGAVLGVGKEVSEQVTQYNWPDGAYILMWEETDEKPTNKLINSILC